MDAPPAPPAPAAQGLEKVLGFWDLTSFGIASILGSGGFNLISKGVIDGGPAFPLALGGVVALFQGASKVYEEAYKAFKTNTSESDIVESIFGRGIAKLTAIFILLFNIFSISTILVFAAKTIVSEGKWQGQVGVALLILGTMTAGSMRGIEFSKEVINFFTMCTLGLLLLGTGIGLWEGFGPTGTPPDAFPTSLMPVQNLPESILFFYFILSGFDDIMKFVEESKNPDKDIPNAFYWSNRFSAILVLGIAYAFVHMLTLKLYKNPPTENVVGLILETALGSKSARVVHIISIFLMVATAYVSFLSMSRYLYSLSEKAKEDTDMHPLLAKVLQWFNVLNENRSPSRAVLFTSLLSGLAILINHTTLLVRFADVFSILTILIVSFSVCVMRARKGELPWIEGATAGGLVWILSACCWPF